MSSIVHTKVSASRSRSLKFLRDLCLNSLDLRCHANDGALAGGYVSTPVSSTRARFGGKLVFLIKMGPFVLDSSTVACKPAYGGNVYVYYSLDSGGTWETLTILETFSLRNEKFTEVNTYDTIKQGVQLAPQGSVDSKAPSTKNLVARSVYGQARVQYCSRASSSRKQRQELRYVGVSFRVGKEQWH